MPSLSPSKLLKAIRGSSSSSPTAEPSSLAIDTVDPVPELSSSNDVSGSTDTPNDEALTSDPEEEEAEETTTTTTTQGESNNSSAMSPASAAALMHWSAYGAFNDRPDDPKTPRAAASTWGKCTPLLKPVSLPWDVPVHQDDVHRMIQGFIPKEMEDKWFIWSEDIQVLDREGETVPGLRVFFVRSWTGLTVLELEVAFSRELDEAGRPRSTRVTKLTYETSKKSVNGVNEDWAKETARETCAWVLRVRLGQEGAESAEGVEGVEDNE